MDLSGAVEGSWVVGMRLERIEGGFGGGVRCEEGVIEV